MKGLTPEQYNAVNLLVQGKTDQAVAAAVGVTGDTVTRWRCADARFIAALNRQRNARWQSAHERLRALVHKAVDVLERAVDGGDVRAAMEVLKAAKLYGELTPPTGPEDPELVLWQQAEAWAATEIQREGPPEDPALALLVRDGKRARLARQQFAELRQALEEPAP